MNGTLEMIKNLNIYTENTVIMFATMCSFEVSM